MNILETKYIDKYFHDPVEFQIAKKIFRLMLRKEISNNDWKIREWKSTLLLYPINYGYRLQKENYTLTTNY